MNQTRLKQRLHYDPETGIFRWRAPEKPGNNPEGQIAGSHCNKGYLVIGIDKKVYKAHRLAWLYMTGSWPTSQIDHRNTVKDDNRWANLREATNAQNCCNRTRYNRTGYKGVAQQPNGRYVGRCVIQGQRYQRGGLATAEEAASWVTAKRNEVHGAFARHQ